MSQYSDSKEGARTFQSPLIPIVDGQMQAWHLRILRFIYSRSLPVSERSSVLSSDLHPLGSVEDQEPVVQWNVARNVDDSVGPNLATA